MDAKTILALSAGTGAMLILIAVLMISYKEKLWKSVPVSLLLTITGTLGTYIWFFVELSGWGGRSYYGAVFLVPVAFMFVARWMRIPYGDLMDYCAPAECVMLAIMKYQCLVDGCCGGIILRVLEDGSEVLFPSQIVELVNALVVMAILLVIAIKKKYRGKVYAWYLIIYGVLRFILNWFRSDNLPLLLGLPSGNIWSLLAVFIGVLWLLDLRLAIVKKTSAPKAQPTAEDEKDE